MRINHGERLSFDDNKNLLINDVSFLSNFNESIDLHDTNGLVFETTWSCASPPTVEVKTFDELESGIDHQIRRNLIFLSHEASFFIIFDFVFPFLKVNVQHTSEEPSLEDLF